MANGEEYYNPIISAYLRAVEQKNQKDQFHQKLQLESDQQKAEQKYRQQLADQAQQRIDSEHQAHLDELEQQKTVNAHNAGMLRIATDQAHRVMTDSVRKHILEGDSPESAAGAEGGAIDQGVPAYSIPPGGNEQPVGESIKLPGGTSIPTAGLMTPEREAQQVAQKAGLVTQAQHEAELPSQLKLEEQKSLGQRLLEGNKQKFEAGQKEADRQNKTLTTQLTNQSREHVAQGTNAARIIAAGISNDKNKPTPEELQSGILQLATGTRKFNSDNPYDRAVQAGADAAGFRQLDPADVKVLQASQSLVPLFDKARDFANTLPDEAKDGPLVASTKAYAQGKLMNTNLPLDKKVELNQLKTNIVNIGKQIEGMSGGRITNTQLSVAMDGLANGNMTKQQALKTIDNLADLYVNKETNVTLGGVGKTQQEIIYKKYGIKPAFLVTAPKKNATGHTLDEDKSLELGQAVYK